MTCLLGIGETHPVGTGFVIMMKKTTIVMITMNIMNMMIYDENDDEDYGVIGVGQ